MREEFIPTTSEELERQVYYNRGVEYKVHDGFEFDDVHTEMTFIHDAKHRSPHKFKCTPYELLNTSFQCPHCDRHNLSKGIAKIKEFLDNSPIAYRLNQSLEFDDIEVEFDFHVPEYNLYISYLSTGRCINVMNRSEESQQIRDLCNEYAISLLEIIHADYDEIEELMYAIIEGEDPEALYGGK